MLFWRRGGKNWAENTYGLKAMKRTVRKSSVFPSDTATIWEHLQHMQTLQYIAFPFAVFKNVKGYGDFKWEEGESFEVYFRLFGIIPFGIHCIKIIKFDQANFQILSNESNRFVPIWNHRIYLHSIDSEHTEYTDEVEIDAGWKTLFVYLWANLFYRHRQIRWIKLLK